MRNRPHSWFGFILVLGLAALTGRTLWGQADPHGLIEAMSSSSLDMSAARRVVDFRLEIGTIEIVLDEGLLVPVRTPLDLPMEMVFIGRGQVRLVAPDAIEAGQLEFFTGTGNLNEPFTEAVLVVPSPASRRRLLAEPPITLDAATARRARQRYAHWRASPERRLLAVNASMLSRAVGDRWYDEYFAASFAGSELGEIVLLIDPDDEEQISLGQFVPLEATAREKRRFSRTLNREQRHGRLIGVELDDLGIWDTWMSFTRRTGPGRPAFEPRHYEIDITVVPKSGEISGRTVLELAATMGERRVAHLSLHRDLAISRLVQDSRELPFLREGSEIHAILPAAPAAGEVIEVEVEYAGHFLDKGRDRNWVLRDALAWYPHAGTVDRATYDVTLRRPPKYDLLAGGVWVASGGDRKLRWDHRRLDVPAIGFSFEVGRFELRRVFTGDVSVTLAFDPRLVELFGDTVSDITAAVTDSLAFYEETFGPYPLDELVVVTVPRDYSQAMLGFVTLSNRMMIDWGEFGAVLGLTDRRAVVAHEIAHQWWGHQVGWRGYRDRWISEAMANYASHLWTSERLGWLGLASLTSGWQEELTAPIADGRPLESLGPLILGHRLDSSRANGAYESIVYRKGALVVGMLAQLFGPERFRELLRVVIRESRVEAPSRESGEGNSVLSTEDFLALLEASSGVDLEAFAERFIYGTGLPEVFYSYDFEKTVDDRWRVRILARQEKPHHFRYELVERRDGSLDVARRRVDQTPVGEMPLVVPFQVTFAGGMTGLEGQFEISGPETEIAFEVDPTPEEVWLDTQREVYGRFFNERRHPKRRLLYRGFDLAAAGEAEKAEALFYEALSMSTPTFHGASSNLHQLQAMADRLLNAQIHLELARLRLESGRGEAARRSLDAAQAALDPAEQDWILGDLHILEARLDLRAGAAEKAFRRLKRDVLKDHRLDSAESYLLLAVAARETGNERELEEALRRARKSGADVSLLLPAAPSIAEGDRP